MRFVFLMDPLEGVLYHKDTSFIFMLGAADRGHETWYLAKDGLSLGPQGPILRATRVSPQRNEEAPFVIHETRDLEGGEVDAVFIRTDPPFDEGYLMHTWILDQLDAVVMNAPSGIRSVNEKVWALRFPQLQPPTMVTARADLFQAFLATHGRIIAKPTNGFGGAGVFRVSAGDSNAGVIFETLTGNGEREIILQGYVPAAEIGDKRILLLGGEPIGAVLRVHGEGDHRNNFFAGGSAHATEITDRDREICDTLAPHLRELGLHFVGIDVIGEHLIEVNVTSPTCLQEMNRLYDQQLQDQVIAYVEGLVNARR